MTTSAAATTIVIAPAADHAAVARFERVYDACHLTLLNTLRRGLASAWQAARGGWDESVGGVAPEELAQETWLRVWRQWPELADARDDRMLYSYALTTARHVLIDHVRHRQMRQRVGECALSDEGWDAVAASVPSLEPTEQPEAMLLDAEILAAVRAAVSDIAVSHGKARTATSGPVALALLAGVVEGEPLAAIAARLGLSQPAVKMRLWRIRQELRVLRAWNGNDNDDDGSDGDAEDDAEGDAL